MMRLRLALRPTRFRRFYCEPNGMNPELRKMLETINRKQCEADVDLRDSLRMMRKVLDAIDKKIVAPESQSTPRWFYFFIFGFAAAPILLIALDAMSS